MPKSRKTSDQSKENVMFRKKRLKGDVNIKGYIIFLTLLGVGFGCFALHLFYNAMRGPYLQIPEFAIGGFFCVFAILSFFGITKLDRIEVFDGNLVITSILGWVKATIPLNEIVSWTELEKETKTRGWTELTIYTCKDKYSISSTLYKNYDDFKRVLTQGKERDIAFTVRSIRGLQKQNAIIYLLTGILFIFFASTIFSSNNKELKNYSPAELQKVVASEIDFHGGAKGSRSINLSVKEYPDFVFQIIGDSYSAANSALLRVKVKPGDTVSIGIDNRDYETKITKEEPLSFFEKTINYKFIPIYSLQDNENIYLTTAGIEKARRDDYVLGQWVLVISAMFGLSCIVLGGLYVMKS